MPSLSFLRRAPRLVDLEMGAELDGVLAKSFPSMSILERHHAENDEALEQLRLDKLRFEEEIANLSEKLRQTNVAINAREVAGQIYEVGKDGGAKLKPVMLRGSAADFAKLADAVDEADRVIKSRSKPPHTQPGADNGLPDRIVHRGARNGTDSNG